MSNWKYFSLAHFPYANITRSFELWWICLVIWYKPQILMNCSSCILFNNQLVFPLWSEEEGPCDNFTTFKNTAFILLPYYCPALIRQLCGIATKPGRKTVKDLSTSLHWCSLQPILHPCQIQLMRIHFSYGLSLETQYILCPDGNLE